MWTGHYEESKHPRDARGRFARKNLSRKQFDRMQKWEQAQHVKQGGVVSDHHVSDLLERINQPDGGFTYSPLSGKEPKEGFALSLYPQHSHAVGLKELKPVDIVRYYKANKSLLKEKGNYLGAWHDPATHKVFFDISTVVPTAHAAERLALRHDQIAYFDLKHGKSITVNRHATSGGQA